jgi:DNA-binding transcriptional MocR family regulator
MPIMFASTSKITFPGSGVALISSSTENLNNFKKYMCVQTIGPDKINQLRHVKFFKDKNGVFEHMRRHASILEPKFNAIVTAFEKELAGTGIAHWTNPKGGYFISFDSLPGCAKDIYNLCLEAGLTLTNAGATYPYGKDPDDKNIRIAPSFPSVDQLNAAVERFIVCVKVVSIRKILSDRNK